MHKNIEFIKKMSKARVKVNAAQKTMKDPELIDMFNKMVGCGEPDPNIVIPKYEKIVDNSSGILQILSAFLKSPFAQIFYVEFTKGFDDIKEFVKVSELALNEVKLEKNDKILSGDELNQINSNPEKLQEYLTNMDLQYKINKLGETYTNLKNSNFIKEFIMTTRNIKNALMLEKERTNSQVHDLENKETLSANFINKADGDFLNLFSFSSLDFKQLYYHELMTPELSIYVLKVLHLIYIRSLNIVKDVTSPDIDVDKFSELLVNNIENIKTQIPRCDKAFDKIKQSVELLKSNFGEYYKDFISSQNPGIIVEHFVVDVAKGSEADLATTHQFRKIIEFYKGHMQSNIKDPKIKKIFKMVSENLDILESQYTNPDS